MKLNSFNPEDITRWAPYWTRCGGTVTIVRLRGAGKYERFPFSSRQKVI